MSVKSDKAKELFLMGYNCAQAVSAVFADNYGITQDNILKMSCGFGGGMRNAEVCGAVSGAVMVIGMKYGNGSVNSPDVKAFCYQKTVEFTNRFREKNGSIICRELLGADISKDDGMKKAQDANLFHTTCIEMITDAVDLLEQLQY